VSEIRRYDMVFDKNSDTAWKMQRQAEGQYVPFLDYEKAVGLLQQELRDVLVKFRWNIQESPTGDVLSICRHLHDKALSCQWEDYIPKDAHNQLIREIEDVDCDAFSKGFVKGLREARDICLARVIRPDPGDPTGKSVDGPIRDCLNKLCDRIQELQPMTEAVEDDA
jgi:hypothetical protein